MQIATILCHSLFSLFVMGGFVMESKLVLIAGGSGCGKSALAQSLRMKYPNTFALLHLDDYYMRASSAMKLQNGAANWEHPDSLDFDHVVFDVCTLLEGNSVTVSTKSEFYNPGYLPTLHNKISQVVEPRPIVFVGRVSHAAYSRATRELSELSMYLDYTNRRLTCAAFRK